MATLHPDLQRALVYKAQVSRLEAEMSAICSRHGWKALADCGLLIQTIKVYRNENKCSLVDAKEAVEFYRSGSPCVT